MTAVFLLCFLEEDEASKTVHFRCFPCHARGRFFVLFGLLLLLLWLVVVAAVVFFLWLDSVGDEIQPKEIDLSSWNCSTDRHDLKTEKPKETKRFHRK